MLTGSVIAYPTLIDYLVPPDAEGLEFSVSEPNKADVNQSFESGPKVPSNPRIIQKILNDIDQ